MIFSIFFDSANFRRILWTLMDSLFTVALSSGRGVSLRRPYVIIISTPRRDSTEPLMFPFDAHSSCEDINIFA